MKLFSDAGQRWADSDHGRWEPPVQPYPYLEESARAEARESMGRAGEVAEAFDPGGVLMPEDLADLVVLAHKLPAQCPPGIRDALFGTIGERFVSWVEDCLAADIERHKREMCDD